MGSVRFDDIDKLEVTVRLAGAVLLESSVRFDIVKLVCLVWLEGSVILESTVWFNAVLFEGTVLLEVV